MNDKARKKQMKNQEGKNRLCLRERKDDGVLKKEIKTGVIN